MGPLLPADEPLSAQAKQTPHAGAQLRLREPSSQPSPGRVTGPGPPLHPEVSIHMWLPWSPQKRAEERRWCKRGGPGWQRCMPPALNPSARMMPGSSSMQGWLGTGSPLRAQEPRLHRGAVSHPQARRRQQTRRVTAVLPSGQQSCRVRRSPLQGPRVPARAQCSHRHPHAGPGGALQRVFNPRQPRRSWHQACSFRRAQGCLRWALPIRPPGAVLSARAGVPAHSRARAGTQGPSADVQERARTPHARVPS